MRAKSIIKKSRTYLVDPIKYLEYAENNQPFEITTEYVNEKFEEVVVKMQEQEFVGDVANILKTENSSNELFSRERYISYNDDNRIPFWELTFEQFTEKIESLGETIQHNKKISHYHNVGLKSGHNKLVEIIIYVSNKTVEIGNERYGILDYIRKDTSKIYAHVSFTNDELIEAFNCPEFLSELDSRYLI